MIKSILPAMSAVALITMTLVHALGLAAAPLHLSFVPVWLLFMIISALPLAFVDALLVRRTPKMPLESLISITREADISTRWRLLAPLSMLALALLMGQSSHYATHNMAWTQPSVMLKESLPYLIIFFAAGFAWVGMGRLLSFVSVLVPAALITNAMSASLTFEFFLLTPQQWQWVATVALLSSVGTSGVYAWLLLQQTPQQHASSQVLPLWLTQTVVGLLALVAGQATDTIYLVMYMLCAIFALAVCAQTIGAQLQAKGIAKPIALGGALLAAVLTTSAAEYVAFDYVLKVVMLLSVLGFAMLAGWMIKISHARKALNFSQEGVYNLWRVIIRLVVPVSVLWLLVSMAL